MVYQVYEQHLMRRLVPDKLAHGNLLLSKIAPGEELETL